MANPLQVFVEFEPEFYDLDPMQIVWHGNYFKFFELGRRALLNQIGYGYSEMEASGYAWPVVTSQIKYIKPLRLRQLAMVEATLLEYENRLRIGYRIIDIETGACVTKGESVQMALSIKSGESLFVSPDCLVERVKSLESELGGDYV